MATPSEEQPQQVSWRVAAISTRVSEVPTSCRVSVSQDDFLAGLDFGELNITSQDDDILDEAAGHIQENLEDELVQEALRKVRPLPLCMGV